MLRYRRLVYLVDDWSTTSLRMPKVRNKEIYSCLHYLKSQNLSASLTVPTTFSIAGKLVQSKDSFDVVNPAFRADVTLRPVSKLKLTSGR
jgi:hypothetical protein